jgi:hypothetical protein
MLYQRETAYVVDGSPFAASFAFSAADRRLVLSGLRVAGRGGDLKDAFVKPLLPQWLILWIKDQFEKKIV